MNSEEETVPAPFDGPYCFQEGWKSIDGGWYCERMFNHTGRHAAFINEFAFVAPDDPIFWTREQGTSPDPKDEGLV